MKYYVGDVLFYIEHKTGELIKCFIFKDYGNECYAIQDEFGCIEYWSGDEIEQHYFTNETVKCALNAYVRENH